MNSFLTSALSSMANGGGPGSTPGAPPMGLNPQLLQQLPRILSILGNFGSAAVGFVFTLVFFLVFVGPSGFRADIAPVAGFHLLVLFLWREVHETVMEGLKSIGQAKKEKRQQQELVKDISMSFTTKLD